MVSPCEASREQPVVHAEGRREEKESEKPWKEERVKMVGQSRKKEWNHCYRYCNDESHIHVIREETVINKRGNCDKRGKLTQNLVCSGRVARL